ncbi:MAG: hypothetical protein AAFR67_00755 [Chloroflexota bacterium]
MSSGFKHRTDEIEEIRKENLLFYQVSIALTLLLIGIFIGLNLFTDQEGYITNLFTEVLSICLTIFILDRLNERRAQQELNERLIRQFGGQSNEFAKNAVSELNYREFLCEPVQPQEYVPIQIGIF